MKFEVMKSENGRGQVRYEIAAEGSGYSPGCGPVRVDVILANLARCPGRQCKSRGVAYWDKLTEVEQAIYRLADYFAERERHIYRRTDKLEVNPERDVAEQLQQWEESKNDSDA